MIRNDILIGAIPCFLVGVQLRMTHQYSLLLRQEIRDTPAALVCIIGFGKHRVTLEIPVGYGHVQHYTPSALTLQPVHQTGKPP